MSKKSKAAVEEAPVAQPFEPSVMVKLISCDDHVFYCDRNCAKISKLIRHCLTGEKVASALDTSEAAKLEVAASDTNLACVRFAFLSADKLEKGIQFMYMKYRYDGESIDHRPPHPTPATTQEHLELMSLAMLLQI